MAGQLEVVGTAGVGEGVQVGKSRFGLWSLCGSILFKSVLHDILACLHQFPELWMCGNACYPGKETYGRVYRNGMILERPGNLGYTGSVFGGVLIVCWAR